MVIEWNVAFIVVLIIVACAGLHGFKNGMVEEVTTLLSLIIAVAILGLVAWAYGSYTKRNISHMLVAIIGVLLLGIVMKLVKIIIVSLKVIAKLPLIHGIDKLAGIVVGFAEGIIFVWIGFLIFDTFNIGGFGPALGRMIGENVILSVINNCNIIRIFAGH